MVYKGGATIVVMGMIGMFGWLEGAIERVWSGCERLGVFGVVCGSVWEGLCVIRW